MNAGATFSKRCGGTSYLHLQIEPQVHLGRRLPPKAPVLQGIFNENDLHIRRGGSERLQPLANARIEVFLGSFRTARKDKYFDQQGARGFAGGYGIVAFLEAVHAVVVVMVGNFESFDQSFVDGGVDGLLFGRGVEAAEGDGD